MNERKPGFIDGFTRADDTLLGIEKSLAEINFHIKSREERDTKIFFFLIPDNGGERTFSVGETTIDFKQGTITNPDETKESLRHSLNGYHVTGLHSLTIRTNQDIKYRIQNFDERTLYANYAARIPYITYDSLRITCTASTEISLFACTNPSAVIDEFSVVSGLGQTNIGEDNVEAQTWDTTLTSLINNLNRIRHQIVAITGAAWGSASAALLKNTYNANTIIKADSDNTPIALTLAEQRILGRITGGSITGLTAAQIRTLINVADGATKYPDTGEQAFLDADHTKLDAIAANATKYPDTGEQAFLDADHTKLDAIAANATKYPDTGEQAFLDADHTKLNGIEATADITDAINVASTIHGVAAKITPVNADEVGIVDSAAANVLKKLTWTNIKATLKTYFDTLYTKYPDTGEQAFLDADHTKLDAIAANATKYPDTGEQAFLDADHTKLNGIATAATKYPDTGEQAFLDADHTKLNGIETSATADLTGLEIVALLEALAAASRLSHTKLDDIGASDHHAKYIDAEAVTAVATADDYLKNDNDDTLTGQLTITHNTASKPLLVLTRGASTQLLLMEYPANSMEVFLEAGDSIGLFGTKSQHDMHIRTNYVTRVVIDKDGVDMDVKNMVIKNVADPTNNQDACTKAFMIANKYPDTGEQAFLDADHTKLNGIATAATKYPDTGEQAFLDADHTKLNGIETSATADLTGAEIVVLLEALAAASRLSHTKLDDIGASDHHAKYTDANAVTAMGAKADGNPLHHDKATEFTQNDEISLGNIPFAIYTPQNFTGTAHTYIKQIDNTNTLSFCIVDKPTAPSGWTLKGRLCTLMYTTTGDTSYIELFNTDTSLQITQIATTNLYPSILRSILFDMPAVDELIRITAWSSDATAIAKIRGVWVEYIGVKD